MTKFCFWVRAFQFQLNFVFLELIEPKIYSSSSFLLNQKPKFSSTSTKDSFSHSKFQLIEITKLKVSKEEHYKSFTLALTPLWRNTVNVEKYNSLIKLLLNGRTLGYKRDVCQKEYLKHEGDRKGSNLIQNRVTSFKDYPATYVVLPTNPEMWEVPTSKQLREKLQKQKWQ